jgi:phosphate transport system substrate-binding protein
MSANEIETAKTKTGKTPKEFIVGQDALAIYVNNFNPIDTISIPELKEIYGEGGTATKWKDLGIANSECGGEGEIVVVSRQNSSGTYEYFREAVLGKTGEFRQGMMSQTGSRDLVTIISTVPCAIGYSGMGYKTDEVKFVKVSKAKGEPGILPTVETALDGTYPISRPLFLYTLGEPAGVISEFITWVQGEEGQKVIEDEGFVPLKGDKPAH